MVVARYDDNVKVVLEKLDLMCKKVEISVENSISSLMSRDLKMSKQLIDYDKEINILQKDIEDLCLKILLLEHPFAGEFRGISAVLKLVTDLERIGDYAVNISENSLAIGNEKIISEAKILVDMSKHAIEMLKDSVTSYIKKDINVALGLEARDDVIDEMFERAKSTFVDVIKKDSSKAGQAILLLMIAQYIERVADHAVNIGEWTEYAIEGYRRIVIDKEEEREKRKKGK